MPTAADIGLLRLFLPHLGDLGILPVRGEELVDVDVAPAPRAQLASRLHSYTLAWAKTDGKSVLPLRQDELAELAGLSRKTVNGFLREFEKLGLIALGYREIVVLDAETLRGIISADRET